MPRRLPATLLALALAALPAASGLAVSDDFGDGVRAPLWTEIEDDPARLAVVEQNGRLEVLATPGGTANDDALYLSDGPSGFALGTDTYFALQVDFHFGSVATALTALSLTFGMGTTAGGEDSFSFGYGWGFVAAGYVGAVRTDDAQTLLTPIPDPLPTDGTFYISYDAVLDEVYLSHLGYGAGDADYTLSNLVQGSWGAEQLLVGVGARGSGLTLGSGDAWLDDFQVVSGVVVPEPATGLLVAAGVAALASRRRRSRRV